MPEPVYAAVAVGEMEAVEDGAHATSAKKINNNASEELFKQNGRFLFLGMGYFNLLLVERFPAMASYEPPFNLFYLACQQYQLEGTGK